MKYKFILFTLLLVFFGNSLANNPPDGVSSQQWQNIKQQIATSKYYPKVDKAGFYTAYNTAQDWQVHYATNGMTTIKNNDYHIGMKLLSIGTLPLEKIPDIEVKKNTLYYHHSPQIKEWWVNSADKVEQWFSIKKRPTTSTNKLKVQIELDTDTQVSQSGDQLTFTTQNGLNINYNRLKVWDSQGTILPSHMQLADNHQSFELIIDDSHAKYPVIIDPSFSQNNYIKPTVIDAQDYFGYSVDIDGSFMVVGVHAEDSASTSINGDSSDNSAPSAGAAYAFKRSGFDWVQLAYLKASNAEALDFFGESVAISGTTIVVGAPNEDGDSNSTATEPNNFQGSGGAVYVFTYDGTIWSQQAYLKAHETGSDEFGGSVAIDGNTIVVGSKWEDGDTNSTMLSTNNSAQNAGAAYVFTRSGTTWSQEAYLKASNAETDDQFGYSVGISGDTIVVGAFEEDGDANSDIGAFNNAAIDAGAAYVFTRSDAVWTQQAYLKASNAGPVDTFGYSASIDSDTIIIGAYLEDGDDTSNFNTPNNNAIDAGAAYVFVRNDTTWSQQAYLKAANAEADDQFGISVALAGETLVVGAIEEDGDATSTMEFPNNNFDFFDTNHVGAAYVYSRQNANWIQRDYLKASNADRNQKFGISVALSREYIAVGANWENGDATSTMNLPNDNSTSAGAVYIYTGRYYIGGNVTGLPSGQAVELIRNGTEILSVTNNGVFEFTSDVTGASTYNVNVSSAPVGYTCSIVNASGPVNYNDVTNVNVYCSTSTYSVTGTVSGLTGTGLALRNNGIYDVIINSNGSFDFTPEFANGTPYDVVVLTQPNNGQTCSITNGSGTISGGDTNISVVCVGADFDIGGTVSGLTGTLVLQNNGGDDLTLTNNGDFTFVTPITDGNTYNVSVLSQPNGQTCAINNPSGTVAGADVTNVQLTCTDNTYFVGGTVNGLAAAGLILQNNGNDDLNINGNGSFVFSQPLIDNSNYAVTVASQPNNQSCTVINASGTIASSDVVNVGVDCTTNTYIVGVSVVGLTDTGLVMQNNGGDDLSIIQNGNIPFNTQLINGNPFNVTIFSQPNDSGNTCEIIGTSSGVIAGEHVVISVVCGNDLIFVNGFE